MDVVTLFNKIKHKSKLLRKADPHFDGLRFWHSIKSHLSESNFTAHAWKTIDSQVVEQVMDIPEYIITAKGETKIIEKNHFLIQTVRIPCSEKPKLVKILQIALNIGQYQGVGGTSQFLVGRTKVTDYISKADAETRIELAGLDKILKVLDTPVS